MNLYRRWLLARGYKKLAKQMAKDPRYQELLAKRMERRRKDA